MQYHIDTIPVWDAVKLGGECPLCALYRKNERLDVQRFLGASVMEPDTRIRVNAKGFCPKHLSLMFAEKNRLGLALMLDTHMQETHRAVDSILAKAKEGAAFASGGPVFKRMFRKSDLSSPLKSAAKALLETTSGCVICDSLQTHMDRYVYTMLYLWERDKDFRQAFSASKGVCLPHGASLLAMAEDFLPAKELASFVETLSGLITQSLDRINQEVHWFTLKFDYRNQDKPWGDAKDSVERAANKLRGFCAGAEPWPEK